MTSLLRISAHTRRKPEDPYAAIREAKTQQLREEVALADLERAIAALVARDVERKVH